MLKENSNEVSIAIIDDEVMNLEMIGFIIGKLGYLTIPIQNSLEALNQLVKIKPDLILLDVQMPKLNGFELCKLIKKTPHIKDIPIIFITGMNSPENKIKGLEIGGVDYVTKPFNPLELKARVKTHVELSLAKKNIENQATKLRESLNLKNRIFSIIGHDLRSPLSAAKLKMDFILRGIIDPKKDDFLDSTVYELSRTMDEALNLLQNLLGWGRSESNQIEIIPEELDIHQIAEETFRLLKIGSEHKQIKLINQVPIEYKAFADLNTIKTVLRNLVSNAIKFTSKEGEVTINAKKENNRIRIAVIDNGQGISKDDTKKILNTKEHFSNLGTEREPGTGLGLVLCQIFVKKNGGTLKVESEVGRGSTFHFDLPLEKIINN